MATPDLPAEAVEAAREVAATMLGKVYDEFGQALLVDRILAAAAPHMHTDCGCAAACVAKPSIVAQRDAEVDAALRERLRPLLPPTQIDDILRDTLGAGGDGEG